MILSVYHLLSPRHAYIAIKFIKLHWKIFQGMFIRFRKKPASADLHDLPDHELILSYKDSGNSEVIAILFQRYTHLVYGVSLKYLADPDDAKDAVMEIFEGLMDAFHKHEIHNFKSWLHSVTRNHCLMMLRKRKPERLDANRAEDDLGEDFVENGDVLHQDDEFANVSRESLDAALGSLKVPQRKCLELVYLEGKSYQQVCDLTGYSMKEVKSHVQNGKRNLRIRLEKPHVRKT